MKLPHGHRAYIDQQKLIAYSLDPEHDEGRHKAHLFESMVGINLQNSELLLNAVQQAAVTGEAAVGKLDNGRRYSYAPAPAYSGNVVRSYSGNSGQASRPAWLLQKSDPRKFSGR